MACYEKIINEYFVKIIFYMVERLNEILIIVNDIVKKVRNCEFNPSEGGYDFYRLLFTCLIYFMISHQSIFGKNKLIENKSQHKFPLIFARRFFSNVTYELSRRISSLVEGQAKKQSHFHIYNIS